MSNKYILLLDLKDANMDIMSFFDLKWPLKLFKTQHDDDDAELLQKMFQLRHRDHERDHRQGASPGVARRSQARR